MDPKSTATPRWVWGIILGLAAIDPLQHIWLLLWMPEGWAHTGFHIGDTPFFLTAMNMFQTDFASPYAVCSADPASWRYFALPHHWVYGALGAAASALHLSHFLALGLANGLCGALYLYAVYRFLCAAQPALARTAFLLFSLGGGLGGWLYLLALIAGWTTQPGFETVFHRIVRYELIEGPFVAPLLVMPRLYYTAPLALGYAVLTGLVRRNGAASAALLAMLFAVTLLNARAGVLFFGAAGCLVLTRDLTGREQLKTLLGLLAPVAAGSIAASWLLSQNPTGAANVDTLLRRVAWAASLVTLLWWHGFTAPRAIRTALAALPPRLALLGGALSGYLLAYGVLYLAHQAYYGNLLHGGDTAAALTISPWALLGIAPGLAWAALRMRRARPEPSSPEADDAALGWIALWLLGLLAFSLSAFERGLTLSLMPERGLILLGPPLALLSAQGLLQLGEAWPRMARIWLPATVASGLLAAAIASLFFQGPLGQRGAVRPFAWTHSELIAADTLAQIKQLPPGRYLAPATAPPLPGDVIVHNRADTRSVLGQPSLEFSGADMLESIKAIQSFYGEDMNDAERARLLREQCVDYVYWTANETPPEWTAAVPWLERVQDGGGAALFRVLPEALP